MNGLRNATPIFTWAQSNGDAAIVDRILIKIMPELMAQGLSTSRNFLKLEKPFEVDASLYELIKKTAETLVGDSYKGE